MERQKAFIDTNVLKNIIGETEQGHEVMKSLIKHDFQIVTFQKCVYEIYSMIKSLAISELTGNNKDDPVKRIMPPEIIPLCKKLYNKMPMGNVYFWYNQCEEWQGWSFFERAEERLNDFANSITTLQEGSLRKKEALKSFQEQHDHLETQRDFVQWKQLIRESFSAVNQKIEENNIRVYNYFEVYGTDWYKQEGFSYEQDLIEDSLVPNEDFEIIMAAVFSKADVFITNETKNTGIIWRTGLSFGLCAPSICFCCPEMLEEAIRGKFNYRFYHKDK